jgi:hypothetical protein
VFCASPDVCEVTGNNPTVHGPRSFVLGTRNGGRTWSTQKLP